MVHDDELNLWAHHLAGKMAEENGANVSDLHRIKSRGVRRRFTITTMNVSFMVDYKRHKLGPKERCGDLHDRHRGFQSYPIRKRDWGKIMLSLRF